MVRRILVILVLLGLMATPLLLRTTQPHGRALPSFIEPDEHGFDPFYSSYCHKAGHTSFTTTNTNLIQGDGLVQMGSNRGCYTPQNEPSLAVSPTNPNDLVAGANDYRLCCDSEGYNDGTGWAYVSHDGGST